MDKRSWVKTAIAVIFGVGSIALIVLEYRKFDEVSPIVPGPQMAPGFDPLSEFRASLTVVPSSASRTIGGRVYIPAYGSIRAMSGRSRIGLATTLSVHNTSSHEILVLNKIDYFGTDGQIVRSLLDGPVAVRPLGTLEFFVPAGDPTAASGGNYLTEWWAAGRMTEPVIEAVMIGTVGTTSYSFVSRGQRLHEVPE